MEIGYQGVYRLETVTGVNKDAGLPAAGHNVAAGGGHRLQRTGRGGTHAHDTAAGQTALVQRTGRLGANLILFSMHHLACHILHLDRPEGAKSHMQ